MAATTAKNCSHRDHLHGETEAWNTALQATLMHFLLAWMRCFFVATEMKSYQNRPKYCTQSACETGGTGTFSQGLKLRLPLLQLLWFCVFKNKREEIVRRQQRHSEIIFCLG